MNNKTTSFKFIGSDEIFLSKGTENSVKYNAVVNASPERKCTVSLDWLSMRLTSSLDVTQFKDGIHKRGDYTFNLFGSGTSIYNSKCYVYHHDKKIGVICFGSRMKIHDGTMTYKLENWVFYDEYYMTVGRDSLTSELFHVLNCELKNISRCDIAIDGLDLDDFLNDYALKGKYEKLGKKNFRPVAYDMDSKRFTGFYVGTWKRGGSRPPKMLCYYNKTREIRDNGNKKDYINSFWEKSGVDTSVDVKRFELSLTSRVFATMLAVDGPDQGGKGKCFGTRKVEINDLFNSENLFALLKLHLSTFFQFVPSRGKSRRSKRKRFDPLGFACLLQSKFIKYEKRAQDSQRTIKIVVKQLLKTAFVTVDKEITTYMKMISDYVRKNDLIIWLHNKQCAWYDEFYAYSLKMGLDYNDFIFTGEPISDIVERFLDYEGYHVPVPLEKI